VPPLVGMSPVTPVRRRVSLRAAVVIERRVLPGASEANEVGRG
jgi:hypothetical protein